MKSVSNFDGMSSRGREYSGNSRMDIMSMKSNAKSRLLDHFTQPPDYTPEEKKDALEAFLDPATVVGLNILKDELSRRLQEKSDMEAYVQNLQNQIKETRNFIEVIDLGNNLVHKEYQKMGDQNHVTLIPLKPYHQFYKGDNISKYLTNGQLKQEVLEDQNYLNIIKKFNDDSKQQIVEHKSAIATLRDDVKNLKLQFITSSVIPLRLILQKERDELKSQVLVQRKQVEVLRTKLREGQGKQREFCNTMNESIMMSVRKVIGGSATNAGGKGLASSTSKANYSFR